MQSEARSSGCVRDATRAGGGSAAACLRVAYSDALFTDTNGVTLHIPPVAPETVHVNVTGP